MQSLFWKDPALSRTALGLLLAGGFTCGLLYCAPGKPVSFQTRKDTFSLFKGAVTLKRTEKDGNYRLKGFLVDSVTYEFEFNTPGNYLFEGWAERYRSNDIRTESWRMNVSHAPFHQTENLDSLVYRLEGTRVVNGEIERDTVLMKHYGGVGMNVQGQQVP